MKTRALIVFFCMFFTLLAITVTLFATGVLPTSLHFSDIDNQHTANESITDKNTDYFTEQPKTPSFPLKPVGVLIDIENEYVHKDLTYFENAVQCAKQMYCNTYFIAPSLSSNAVINGEANADLISHLQTIDSDALKILTIDTRFLLKDGILSFELIRNLLDAYSFDGILINDRDFIKDEEFIDTIGSFADMLTEQYPLILLGISVFDADGLQITEDLLQKSILSFVCIDATADYPTFADLCKKYDDCTYFTLTDVNAVSEGLLYELADLTYIDGLLYSDTEEDNNKRQTIASFYYNSDDGLLVQNISFNSNTESVVFAGTVGENNKLFCNNEAVTHEGSAFSYSYKPLSGENNVSFASAGKKLKYSVELPYTLIDSCYPYGTDIHIQYDEPFIFYAVCLENALVSASLGAQSFPMQQVDEYPEDLAVKTGYAVYSCKMVFDKPGTLGELKITAALDGSCQISNACQNLIAVDEGSDKYKAGVIDHSADDMYYNVAQAGYAHSYYADNGLGKTLMCKITDDNAEQLTIGAYDTYQPVKSTLIEGSWDYVSNIVQEETGYVLYELSSGSSVAAEDASLIINGNSLPLNTISYYALQESDPALTQLAIKVDWPVAVTSCLNDQLYETGYSGYGYNISAFTASYIDITFPHTSQAHGFENLQFSQYSAISMAEIIQNSTESIVLRLHLRRPGHYYGSELRYDDTNGILVIAVKNNISASLVGKTIVIDPGHGGYFMTGTALEDNSFSEKTITLSVANKLKDMLIARGANVVMTRTQDEPLELEDRVKISDTNNPDAFVSLHCDGIENEEYSGTHSFYYTNFSQPLAASVHNRIVEYYRNYIYSPGMEEYDAVDYGIKFYPFAMIRSFECPSIMVEMGFMSNETEGIVLTVEDAQFWIAEAIAVGLNDYFTNY